MNSIGRNFIQFLGFFAKPSNILFSLMSMLLLVGCATTEGEPILVGAPLVAESVGPVNPTMNFPTGGSHISLGIARQWNGSNLFPGEASAATEITGSMLVQPDLGGNGFLGIFGSLTASLVYSIVPAQATSYRLRNVTDEIKDEILRGRNDIFGVVAWRQGFVLKRSEQLLSVYGISSLQYETGDWPDFRRNFDKIGNIYNMDSFPVIPFAGVGIDGSLPVPVNSGGIRNISIGGTVEVTLDFEKSQSYVTSSYTTEVKPGSFGDTETDIYHVTTSGDGKARSVPQVLLQSYLDIDNLRMYFT